MTGMTFSGFEILTISDDDGAAFLASQISGSTMIVTNGNAIVIGDAANTTAVDIATIDMSGLTFADATDVVSVDLTRISGDLTANTAFTYTGSDAADTVQASANGDTISGGAGADTITGGAGDDVITGGEAIDTINAGAGDDTIDLTEATVAVDHLDTADGHSTDSTANTLTLIASGGIAAGDTITFGDGVDTVTGFGSTDTIDIDSIANAAVAPTTLLAVDTTAALTDNVAYVAYGTWDGSTFTIAAAFDADDAKDAMLVTDGQGETLIANDNVMILDDLSAAIGAANIL
jgi:Ca2+-binding RTX toxin-like protein